jgi:hypothetical protein
MLLTLCGMAGFHPGTAGAQACFLRDGKLAFADASSLAKSAGADSSTTYIQSTKALSAVWGRLTDGRAVATLANPHAEDADAVEGHSHDAAGPLAAIGHDGSAETLITTDVLRAFVSPAGDALAAITPSRDLLIRHADATIVQVAAPGRVSHVAWSPDGKRIAAAIYPPDFSPHAMDNPRNVEHFLHLQNSDIYIIDAATGTVRSQLTSNPGTDYNPFFSPDGSQLYYTWLHERENSGGLMRLTLDRDDGTSATALPLQITQVGADDGKIPLGRVGTYVFSNTGQSLLFEAGKPDGSGEIWSMSPAGHSARFITEGRKPQLLHDGTIAVLTPQKQVRVLTAKEIGQ